MAAAGDILICNTALGSHLGSRRINSFEESSVAARECRSFYDDWRRYLLYLRPWRLATKTVLLAELDVDSDVYQYVYQKPADLLRPLSLISPTTSEEVEVEYEITEQGLETDLYQAKLRYIADIDDPAFFDEGFRVALGWLAAAHLAMPVGDSAEKQAAMWQGFYRALPPATALNNSQARKEPQHRSRFNSARRT